MSDSVELTPSARGLRIVYACGALKVTTRSDSRSTGPRAHVTGMIGGMRDLGHEVRPLLAGDLVPARVSRAGHGDGVMAGGSWRGRGTDALRVGIGPPLGAATRLRARSADLLYERQATYQVLGAYRSRRVPWVVESNGPFWYEASKERGALSFPALAKGLELRAYQRADLVVAVSEALKSVLVEAGRLPAEDVLVVPNAVDPRRFAAQGGARAATGSEELTIGFVGHVIGWAGLDHLVDAVALARSRGVLVRAVVAGDGPAYTALQDRVASRGAADGVQLLGHISWDDVPSMLARCDIAYSGQIPMEIGSMYHSPLKLYEYSAAGLPVIASDFPDARELVQGAEAGWLVAPGDVEGIASALGDAADRRQELPALGDRVRQHVLEWHTWRQRARLILDELHRRGALPTGEPER